MKAFTEFMTRFFQFALALLVILLICYLPTVEAADPDVKYCQNLVTGEIAVVKRGAPCPYPMAEM